MKTPFDQLAKQILQGGLSRSGSVKTELEVAGEPQYVDVSYAPDPTAARAVIRKRSDDIAGLHGSM